VSAAFDEYVRALMQWSRSDAVVRRGSTNITAAAEQAHRTSNHRRDQTLDRGRRLERSVDRQIEDVRRALADVGAASLLDGLSATAPPSANAATEPLLQEAFARHRAAAAEVINVARQVTAAMPIGELTRPASRGHPVAVIGVITVLLVIAVLAWAFALT
jgi:hypothetical protein